MALCSRKGATSDGLRAAPSDRGCCSSFRGNGFTFNTGVEDVSGLWEKGPVTFLLNELGPEREKLFVKNTSRYIFKEKEIEVKSLEGFMEMLSAMFPEERGKIQAFFEDDRMAYEECNRDSFLYGTPLPPELIVKVFGGRKLMEYPRENPHFSDWMNRTFKQKLDEC